MIINKLFNQILIFTRKFNCTNPRREMPPGGYQGGP